jgi:hypothetical protein
MNLTEPSTMPTFTPPGCRLCADMAIALSPPVAWPSHPSALCQVELVVGVL